MGFGSNGQGQLGVEGMPEILTPVRRGDNEHEKKGRAHSSQKCLAAHRFELSFSSSMIYFVPLFGLCSMICSVPLFFAFVHDLFFCRFFVLCSIRLQSVLSFFIAVAMIVSSSVSPANKINAKQVFLFPHSGCKTGKHSRLSFDIRGGHDGTFNGDGGGEPSLIFFFRK